MRIMTEKQSHILEALRLFAGGDSLLIYDAFERCSTVKSGKNNAQFNKVVEYIYEKRKHGISLEEFKIMITNIVLKYETKPKYIKIFCGLTILLCFAIILMLY